MSFESGGDGTTPALINRVAEDKENAAYAELVVMVMADPVICTNNTEEQRGPEKPQNFKSKTKQELFQMGKC